MSNAADSPIELLMKLTKSEALQKGKFKDFTQELTQLLCSSLDASKSAFWLYRAESDNFVSIQTLDGEANLASSGEIFSSKEFPSFSEKLKNELLVQVDNNAQNEELKNFKEKVVLTNRIGSWVGIQVWNKI